MIKNPTNTHTNILFVKYFYGISLSKNDKKKFHNYLKSKSLKEKELSINKIAKIINIPKSTISRWIYNQNKPFVIRLLDHYLELKKPKNKFKWLSINSTRGGLFTGPWIQVPDKINNFKDIKEVISQLEPLKDFKDKIIKFDLINYKRENLFAFFLGMLVGDSSKTGIKRKQRTTRRVHIRLSKAHETNERLGEFTSMCVNNLGLRMNKCKDCPAGKLNTHDFYTWISQSSPLIQWIFNTCLGLKNNELTTYNKIKMNWILHSPNSFKIAFLQGLADSDGFVDFSSHQVGIITEPNTALMKKIFESIKIKTTPKLLTHNRLWCLILNLKDSYDMPIFNPVINTYRYQQMEKLFKATKISHHYPDWLKNKISNYLNEGIRGTALVKRILKEDNIAIRTKSIRRIERLKS